MTQNAIEDHGVIGDLHTVALVALDGTIDFMCFPRFDSPSIFGSLLDPDGGHFKLAPGFTRMRTKQQYMPDVMVLLTRFDSPEGIAELSDFMPIKGFGHAHDLVRRVKAVRGEVAFHLDFQPRFNYGRSPHRLHFGEKVCVFTSDGPDGTAIRLRSTVPLQHHGNGVAAEFRLQSGETAAFILEEACEESSSPSAAPGYVSESFKQTSDFWRRWIAGSRYRGRWREIVDRSAMVLKLLTYAPCGSLVAAPTFGLPEEIGGARNWDYRYTWIRDASFTLHALMNLGFTTEAAAFMRWVEARCGELEPGNPLQIMYGIDGRHDLPEEPLPHWKGYRDSRPVRIGNGAARQLQLDIYGELLDSVYIYNGLEPISFDFWKHLTRLVNWVVDNWDQPDYGIWEVRGGKYPFLHSRVMCWVAVDRALRLAKNRSFPAPWQRWSQARDEIFMNVYERFWDDELQSFVQFEGSKAVDASALIMPLVRFIAPRDPRWRSTLRVINKSLAEDALVYRYHVLKGAEDGLPGREGTFTMCSFWNVECIARTGDLKQARFLFEKALTYANHVGLFSEQIGLEGDQLGNFPQAFTHLGLISAACFLDENLGGLD